LLKKKKRKKKMQKKKLKHDKQSKLTFFRSFFSRPGGNGRLEVIPRLVNIGPAETLVMSRSARHGNGPTRATARRRSFKE
jgi:hypothetical protein